MLDMRHGWTETALGAVLSIQSGFAFSTNDWTAEGYPVIKINNVRDGKVSTESCSYISDPIPHGAEKFLLGRGDLLITLTGEIGATGVVDQTFPMYLNQRVGKVSIQEESKALLSYVAVLFNFPSVRAEMWSLGKGNAQLNISPKSIQEILVLLPPLAEQKRIVDLVSSVDAYIDALQQQADTARTARNAVLHELLSAGGDGWTETNLGDIAEVLDRMRKPISSSERENRLGDVPYYGATGQAGWIDKPIFDEELVLLGEDAIDFLNPDVHKAYLISGPSWVNNHAHVLRAKKEKVFSFFLMEALNAVDYSQFVAFGTRSKLTQGSMMGISVQVPPLAEQQRIVEIVSSMDDLIQATAQAVVDAKNLRSGLLSGEHEIPASYDSLLGAT
jgi:restriction endonuclease S subunit